MNACQATGIRQWINAHNRRKGWGAQTKKALINMRRRELRDAADAMGIARMVELLPSRAPVIPQSENVGSIRQPVLNLLIGVLIVVYGLGLTLLFLMMRSSQLTLSH